MAKAIPVYIEVGDKKVFACSIDFPGWCRSGRTEEQALEALAAYAPRYAEVAERAKAAFPAPAKVGERFEVVERVKGKGATDFGIPHEIPEADAEPLTARQAARQVDLIPAELRKGPRGGGRDRDKMLDHVLGAEAAYARKVGVKHPQPDLGDTKAIKALRDDLAGTLGGASNGSPPIPKGWPPRYAIRRITWHVLDHVWEMQDRAQ
jgi:hypothetical protein